MIIQLLGALVQIGKSKINYDNWNEDSFIEKNDFFCPDEKYFK